MFENVIQRRNVDAGIGRDGELFLSLIFIFLFKFDRAKALSLNGSREWRGGQGALNFL